LSYGATQSTPVV